MQACSKVNARAFALGLVGFVASGCAAGNSNIPHGRGAGEWSVALPTAASYAQGRAFGRGGSAQPAFADARTQRVAADAPKKKPALKKRRATEPNPTTSEPTPEPTPETPVVPPAGRYERTELAQADTSVLAHYEARQAESKVQQGFQGGNALVIGASTLVIVLLVVLLVVLLL